MIRTREELAERLAECRRAAAVSDTALRASFAGLEGCFDLTHPADPFSDAYRSFQMSIYERLAGRAYSTAHETTPLDIDASVDRPFPFSTASPATAGQHLGAVAFLLRSLRLPPGARVLEFGPGWGNTTIALAQLGFSVTAVDIDPGFCELIQRRARRAGVAIEVVNADFFWAEQVEEPYDAVVFFECFHHCADHVRLLRALHGALLPDGVIYFGAEPILTQYPVPWGVRMDGEALWALGTHGWLELGFRETYFRAVLNRTGWVGRLSRSADIPWISVWEARRFQANPIVVEATDERVGTMTGRKTDTCIEVAAGGAGYALFGPYVALACGAYRAMVQFVPGADLRGPLVMDICSDRANQVHAAMQVDIEAARLGGAASMDFDLADQVDELEVRLLSGPDTIASIARIQIWARDPASQGSVSPTVPTDAARRR